MNPEFPLKVLHKELELSDQDARRDEDKFPVIAISNWKLDASKTNRGIFLQRNDPDKEGLKETGKTIFESIFISSIYKPSKKEIKIPENFAEIYLEIFQAQQKKIKKTEESEERIIRENFFGLRDFYYLIKMIGYDLKDKKEKDRKKKCSKQEILEIVFQSFLRNFGGAPKQFFDEIIQTIIKKIWLLE
ncbi:hypothetical protein M0811_14821 [Anaeramoeba ignava]|uniref:Uncharacterized protein n=1 Tax=Anaeramoeba ignava TaxID=1746090 RepID=A0A9Q0LTF5_ANAIG|nr:hypothetical protein M0811_14821 [Anaeramoeba ignava]